MTLSEEQCRATQAHERVAARARQAGAEWRLYRTMVLKLPVMVHNEGLVVALHFVAARGQKEQRVILDDLAADLELSGRAALLSWVRSMNEVESRQHTREIQRRLGWYKRMVQAYGKQGGELGGGS